MLNIRYCWTAFCWARLVAVVPENCKLNIFKLSQESIKKMIQETKERTEQQLTEQRIATEHRNANECMSGQRMSEWMNKWMNAVL